MLEAKTGVMLIVHSTAISISPQVSYNRSA